MRNNRRQELIEELRIREKAHAKLDELLDRYERGDPLWLNDRLGWSSTQHPGAELSLTIKDSV